MNSRSDILRLAVLMSSPLVMLLLLKVAVREKCASYFLCSVTLEASKGQTLSERPK